MKKQNIPNIITIIRFILIIPVLITLLTEHYKIAFIIFLIAGLSDGVDGYLARRFNWVSKFGARLDPVADKLLMLTSYLCLALLNKIPYWLLFAVIARDLWLSLGALAYLYFIGDPNFQPSRISKLNTIFQIALVVFVLLDNAFVSLPTVFIETLFYIVLLTTISSFIDYTWFWGRRAWSTYKGIDHD